MKCVNDFDVTNKMVFLRVDFNVPLDANLAITDDTRMQAAKETIQYLLDNNARIVMTSHLGRPKGVVEPKKSLKPVFEHLKKMFKCPIAFSEVAIGHTVDGLKANLKPGSMLLLENIRFNEGEKNNDPQFSAELAKNIDVYINDAFGSMHRKHASTYGVPTIIKNKGMGFLVKREIESLAPLLASPKRPFVTFLGGAKVSDKIKVIKNLLNHVDTICIGGAMAYTFLKVKGYSVGKSLYEPELLDEVKSIETLAREKKVAIHLPVDHLVATSETDTSSKNTPDANISDNFIGYDIGSKTIELFSNEVKKANTLFWNGPMGMFENKLYETGTKQIALAMAENKGFTVIGGGDSVSAVKKWNLTSKFTHVSTGGGASLEYMENGTLPGVEILK